MARRLKVEIFSLLIYFPVVHISMPTFDIKKKRLNRLAPEPQEYKCYIMIFFEIMKIIYAGLSS